MKIQDLRLILDRAVKLSKIEYSEGGLRYEIHTLTAEKDLNTECVSAHQSFGDRGYKMGWIAEVSNDEFYEVVIEFFSGVIGKEGKKTAEEAMGLINSNLSPYISYIWESDFEGYGNGLVFAAESEASKLVVLMDWTID